MKAYDVFSSVWGPQRSDPRVLIVSIDPESFARLEQPWPWPRSIHGRLIQSLRSHGARAVILDILFCDPSSPAEDQALEDAIRRSGGVVLAADIESDQSPQFARETLIAPLERFQEAGARYGVSSIPVDVDNVVRRIFWGSEPTPSLELAALELLGMRRLKDYRKLIRFSAGAAAPSAISYYQALDPERHLAPGFLENKIVIVGKHTPPGDAGGTVAGRDNRLHLQPPGPVRGVDMFATPLYILDNRLTAGVAIHAAMLGTLLRDDFLQPLGARGTVLLLLFLSLVLSLLNQHWNPLRSVVLLTLALGVYLSGSVWVFGQRGVFLPFLSPLAVVFINYAAAGALSYIGVERKRRYLRKALALYVSPQVAARIVDHPERLKLGGERVEATILFSDLAGFTTMSENHEPEEVVSILNQCATLITKVVFTHQGTLDKFIGDGVMAVWGSPVPDADQALHACRAALEMQRCIEAHAAAVHLADYRLAMRIGINSGPVLAGNMGSEDRFEFTVLGDHVNTASRLEGLNKTYGTKIIISEITREKIKGRLTVRSLDMVRVRGKKTVSRIYELLDGESPPWLEFFEEGMLLYRGGDFPGAADRFRRVLDTHPADAPARLFANRCEHLQQHPPGAGWRGIWEQQQEGTAE